MNSTKCWPALFAALILSTALHFATTNSDAWFYPGFPGIAVSLLITGGHGGTHMEDNLGLVAEIALNSVIWSLAIWSAMKIYRHIRAA